MKITLPYFLEDYLTKKFGMIHSRIYRTVKDKNGKIISRKKMVGHSTVSNFMYGLYNDFNAHAAAGGAWGSSAPATAPNACRQISGAWSILGTSFGGRLDGLITNDIKGILIGTGSTAPTPGDYKIETQIMHGVGGGQMIYDTCRSTNGVTVLGSVSDLIISRSFVNNSGGTISPSEVAIHVNSAALYYCIYRETFSPDTVNDGQTYTIDILFSMTT